MPHIFEFGAKIFGHMTHFIPLRNLQNYNELLLSAVIEIERSLSLHIIYLNILIGSVKMHIYKLLLPYCFHIITKYKIGFYSQTFKVIFQIRIFVMLLNVFIIPSLSNTAHKLLDVLAALHQNRGGQIPGYMSVQNHFCLALN